MSDLRFRIALRQWLESNSPLDAQTALLAAIRSGVIPVDEPPESFFNDMGVG